jgi:hypothetical protein
MLDSGLKDLLAFETMPFSAPISTALQIQLFGFVPDTSLNIFLQA